MFKRFTFSIIMFMLIFTMSAYASERPASLQELQQQAQETQAPAASTETTAPTEITEPAGSAIGSITSAAKMDREDKQVSALGSVMNQFGAKVIQFLGYILSIGLCLIIALDMVFIAVPPFRNMLANGHDGIDTLNPIENPTGGLHPPVDKKAPPAPPVPVVPKTTQWVTDAALNAVASASNGGNVYKIYLKQQVLIIILAPTIYVLSATGVLPSLGVKLGQALSNILFRF